MLEKDNSGLGDLQKYLKSNKRDLWLPKEQTKEVERGIWSENYLKKLHETLKVTRAKVKPPVHKLRNVANDGRWVGRFCDISQKELNAQFLF